jgi:hypothetical protein
MNITNEELSEMMNDDKMYKHQPIKEGESDCCGAGVYIDIMICSECNDHCDLAEKLCGYCGDVEVDEDEQFCCNDCWNGYKSETFDEKN